MSPKPKEDKDVEKSKKSKLRQFYWDNFPGLRTHHLIPRSRGGPASYFILFPWTEKSHDAWHQLFFNMTVIEVWERLDETHSAIHSGAESVLPFWLEPCTLVGASAKKMAVFEEQKRSKLSSSLNTTKLQGLWWDCFQNDKLTDARTLILYMAMFMIFGSKMVNPESISQADIEVFLSKAIEIQDYRRWAMSICFHRGISAIVSRVNELNSSPQ